MQHNQVSSEQLYRTDTPPDVYPVLLPVIHLQSCRPHIAETEDNPSAPLPADPLVDRSLPAGQLLLVDLLVDLPDLLALLSDSQESGSPSFQKAPPYYQQD